MRIASQGVRTWLTIQNLSRCQVRWISYRALWIKRDLSDHLSICPG